MHTNSGNKVFYVIVRRPVVWNPHTVSLFQFPSPLLKLSVKKQKRGEILQGLVGVFGEDQEKNDVKKSKAKEFPLPSAAAKEYLLLHTAWR